MTSGLLTFARFAYPPNALGLCGPADSASLLQHVDAGVADRELRQLAQAFEGAWPYLELIAAANHIADPLDEVVVEAYWIGNRLLDRVPLSMLAACLDDRFRDRAGRSWSDVAAAALAGGVPHHSFHVFNVYPWVGLMREGLVDEPLRVLDRCRIRWGRVESVCGEYAVVSYQPLVWHKDSLALGPVRIETVTLARGGYRLSTDVRPGEWFALHWNWICEPLTSRRLAGLRAYTMRQLAIANTPIQAPARKSEDQRPCRVTRVDGEPGSSAANTTRLVHI